MATPHPFPSHPVPADPTVRDRVTAVDLRNSMQIETGDEAEGASLTPKTLDNTQVSVTHEVGGFETASRKLHSSFTAASHELHIDFTRLHELRKRFVCT